MKGPCPPNCPDRRPGTKTRPSCHSGCERYRDFWNARRAENKKTLDNTMVDDIHYRGMLKTAKEQRNLKGRNGS